MTTTLIWRWLPICSYGLAPTGGTWIQWCDNGQGALAACDAYEVCRDEMIPATGKAVQSRYFVKFAIGKTGRILLLVSCHV